MIEAFISGIFISSIAVNIEISKKEMLLFSQIKINSNIVFLCEVNQASNGHNFSNGKIWEYLLYYNFENKKFILKIATLTESYANIYESEISDDLYNLQQNKHVFSRIPNYKYTLPARNI